MRLISIDPEKLANDRRVWWLFPTTTVLLAAMWVFLSSRMMLPSRLLPATGFVYLALIIVSSLTDAIWHYVFNWATYSAATIGLALSIIASLVPDGCVVEGVPFGRVEPTSISALLSSNDIGEAALGFLVCFVVMFMLQVLFPGGGAGDLKLCTAIGTLLGWWLGLQTILYGFLLAGFGAIVILTWRLTTPLPAPVDPLSTSNQNPIKSRLSGVIPIGPFLAAGSLIALALSPK